MKFLTSLFTLVITTICFSQNYPTIKATVSSGTDSLGLGNVVLLNPSDTTVIKGDFFENGFFEISTVSFDPVLLRITLDGYPDTLILVEDLAGKSVIDLGAIHLKTNELEGVVITGRIPLFEPGTEGGLIVNVQNTMLASSISALEVLAKSPGVLVGNGTISLVGKGEALIYQDGKRITFEKLLSIPVAQIKKIEVIRNPSSKYDAEGRAVINIISYKSDSEGFQGTVNNHVTFAKSVINSSFVGLDYRKKKWSFTSGYGLTLGKDWNHFVTKKTITDNSDRYYSENDYEDFTRLSYVANYKLGVEYQINEKSSTSLQYDGMSNKYDLDVATNNLFTQTINTNNTRLKTHNDGKTSNSNHSLSINYLNKFDTLGSNVFVGGFYNTFSSNLNDLINEEKFDNEVLTSRILRNNRGQNQIDLMALQTDVVKVMKNASSFEMGVKYSQVSTHGKIEIASMPEGAGDFTIDSNYSNDFVYDESIPAAYLQYKKSFKSIDLRAGVRSEYTIAKGTSILKNQTVIDTNYLNFFPSLSIDKQISDNWGMNFAYSSRITRPKYQELDPFLFYVDSLTSQQGNPRLVPQKVYSSELAVRYKDYSIVFNHNYSTDAIRSVLLPGNSGVNSVIKQQVNIQQLNSFSATLNIPIEYKSWTSYNTASLTLDRFADDRPQFSFSKPSPQLYLYTYNKIKIKKWFSIELFAEYEGAQNDGLFVKKDRFSLSAGLAKAFFKNSLVCRFLANDILRSYRDAGWYEVGNIRYEYNGKLNTNFYRVSVIFYFGRLQNAVYKNNSIGNDNTRRIKQ